MAGGDTQAFFNKYDATRRPIAVTSKLRQYLDLEGNQIHQENIQQKMTSWDLIYYMLRANFDGLESEYCKPPNAIEKERKCTYEYGFTVESIKEAGDKLELGYKDREGILGTTTCDLVVGADGPSSTLRRLLVKETNREYAGYVAWRGIVPENDASPTAKETFVEKFTFYHSAGMQILAYAIPGEGGSLEPGERLINWVWYCNYPRDSPEYKELMTDSDGQSHHVTLPTGKMSDAVLEKQRAYASKILPPQFAELAHKTTQPFVQAITDVISPRNSFFDGKLLLVGDAVAGFRPHTAASTSQAAFDAMKLAELMEGKTDLGEWVEETMEYAREMQKRGVEMGERSQFGRHPLAGNLRGVARA